MMKLLFKLLFNLGYRVKKLSKYDTLAKNNLWDGRIKKVKFTPYECTFLNHTLYVHDYESFLLGYFEVFRDEIYKFRADNPKPYIIDCGANMGISVIYFKWLYPDATVLAFEADPKIFSFLKKNVESFHFTGVELVNKAVFNESGKTLSFLSDGGAGGRLQEPDGGAAVVSVETIRLRDYLSQPVDFLKIDIEGVEDQVLKDCIGKLQNIKVLFIEYHSFLEKEQSLHTILELVHNAGFRYHIKEAFTAKDPFMKRDLNAGMDLQLNIFCYRENLIA